MVGRYLCAFLACLAVSCATHPGPAPTPSSPQAIVREVPSRAPISADPLFDPSKPSLEVPAAALAERDGDDRFAEEPIGRWRHSIFEVSGTVDNSVSVAGPSIVLVKAVWREDHDLTVTVLRDETVLAKATTARGPERRRIAMASAKVTSAGRLVIRATATSAQPVVLELYVGVVERPSKR